MRLGPRTEQSGGVEAEGQNLVAGRQVEKEPVPEMEVARAIEETRGVQRRGKARNGARQEVLSVEDLFNLDAK